MKILASARIIREAFADYFGKVRAKKRLKIADSHALETFLETRASHVAQTSLYGYIRTRAGSRFPELFENDEFVEAINIAKWQIWVACLSDLTIYAGGLLMRHPDRDTAATERLIRGMAQNIITRTQTPEDAGEEFAKSCSQYLARLNDIEWEDVTDGENAFTESPEALVYWAPIVDELKALDSEIVRNSVRFRWQEVRRDLRSSLDPAALHASGSPP